MGLLRSLWFKTAQLGMWRRNLCVSIAIDLSRVYRSEMQVKDVCRPLASDFNTVTARQMLDEKVQCERRISFVLPLMSQLPLCAVKSNLMLSPVSHHAGTCMSLQRSPPGVTFTHGNISTCFSSHLISLNMKFVSQFYKLLLTNVCTTSSSPSSLFLCFYHPNPPHTHVVSLKHTPTPLSSFHPSLFLYSHCNLELHAARRRTKWLASLLFVFFLCCECDYKNQEEQQHQQPNQTWRNIKQTN